MARQVIKTTSGDGPTGSGRIIIGGANVSNPNQGDLTYSFPTTQSLAQDGNDPTAVINGDAAGSIGVLQFPSDVLSQTNHASHVMEIQILQNNISDFGALANEFAQVIAKGGDLVGSAVSDVAQSVGISKGSADDSKQGNGYSSASDLLNSLKNHYTLLSGAIYLFMPSSVAFQNQQIYTDVSLTDLAVDTVAAGLGGLGNMAGRLPLVGDMIRGVGSSIKTGYQIAQTVSQIGGMPINPQVEVVFSNTSMREFVFDFKMSPSNQDEAESISNIIQMLRQHSAPHPTPDGLFWIAPDIFKITFMHNGVENTSLPRIQECFLTNISVDYAPTGKWATFTTGHPVTVHMMLTFRERLPNDANQIAAGY